MKILFVHCLIIYLHFGNNHIRYYINVLSIEDYNIRTNVMYQSFSDNSTQMLKKW